MNIDIINLSKEVERRRTELSLSQQELANKSNLTYTTIKSIEERKRDKIQRTTILKLAHGLNCEVNELIGKK